MIRRCRDLGGFSDLGGIFLTKRFRETRGGGLIELKDVSLDRCKDRKSRHRQLENIFFFYSLGDIVSQW